MQSSTTPLYQCSPEQLLSATQVDALACINAAQRRVADVLFRVGATERLVRMAHSDLLETLLARAGACIAQSPGYPAEGQGNSRVTFMTLHLELTLATWLGTNANTPQELAAARRCLQVLRTAG